MCVSTAAAAHKRVQSACKVFVALSEAFLKGFSFVVNNDIIPQQYHLYQRGG